MKKYKRIYFLGPKDLTISVWDNYIGFTLFNDNYNFLNQLSKRMIVTWHQETYWGYLLEVL